MLIDGAKVAPFFLLQSEIDRLWIKYTPTNGSQRHMFQTNKNSFMFFLTLKPWRNDKVVALWSHGFESRESLSACGNKVMYVIYHFQTSHDESLVH